MNTNQMDSITDEERNALRGYCERCKTWTNFTRNDAQACCATCGGVFSSKSGFQPTTQRTPLAKGQKLAPSD